MIDKTAMMHEFTRVVLLFGYACMHGPTLLGLRKSGRVDNGL